MTKRHVRKRVTQQEIEKWKRGQKVEQKRLDAAVVFLRGVDSQLDELDQRRTSILASVPGMERQRDLSRGKLSYYKKSLDMYERVARARVRLAEEERKLKSIEALEREREFGRNIAR